jgi:thiamine biosynthesis lipoprotein
VSLTAASLGAASGTGTFLASGPPPREERTLGVPAMGGRLDLRVAAPWPVAPDAPGDLERVARRVERWAARLTRYTTTSDLAALNREPDRPATDVRPTLAAVLDWAERAVDLAPGILDVTLLDERLAAEAGPDGASAATDLPGAAPDGSAPRPRWHLVRGPRGGRVMRRGSFRFDLDGVAKGWIADRALALLGRYPAALVDADGDVALRIDADTAWDIAVADPRPGATDHLAVVRLDARIAGGRLGIATSGTSVHRWAPATDGLARHHLIDPRTRRPALTDVIQATVIGGSARAAEVLAKAAVIAGSDAALGLLDGPGVHGAVLLLEGGGLVATPGTAAWLA